MSASILVVGSSNTDMVVNTSELPGPGQTVLGGTFFMNPGGKGANQAVAAARLGSIVTMLGRVGNDAFGAELKARIAAEGVTTRWVQETPSVSTGSQRLPCATPTTQSSWFRARMPA